MNEKNYILVDKNTLAIVYNTLRQIDKVDGFSNMEKLVGACSALQNIISNSPPVHVTAPDDTSANGGFDQNIMAAAEAAKAEEEARK